MTKVMRYMLMGVALLVLGCWGASLALAGWFFTAVAFIAPIAGIISIIISFLETD